MSSWHCQQTSMRITATTRPARIQVCAGHCTSGSACHCGCRDSALHSLHFAQVLHQALERQGGSYILRHFLRFRNLIRAL